MRRDTDRGTARRGAAAGRGDRILVLALGAALAWFAFQAAWLALGKYFSIDEFQYAHAAWLVGRGAVPYRDFFEVHFPLVYQALAPVFALLGDDPRLIVLLRAGMLGFLALACLGAAATNRDRGRIAMLLAPLFLLALPAFVTLATEIRPDAAAFALFVTALGVLRVERLGDRGSAFASGLLAVGSVWGSQKAALYGAVFPAALVLDLASRVRRGAIRPRPLLRSPIAFAAGGAAGAAAIAVYLTATGSWSAWWAWCFAWAAEHQRHYPGFGFRRYLDPILLDSIWLFALGALGLAGTLRQLWSRGRDARHDPDLLVVAALGTTFASFALQRAPYPYSLLPFLGVAAILAGRGAAILLHAASPLLRAGAAVLLLAVLATQSATLLTFVSASNRGQLATLARIGELTSAQDAAYDNSGGYVSRPHAYRYFYTDSYLREALAETLAREVPAAILESGAVAHLIDLRFDTLPDSLRDFLRAHFQPLDGDLALWGQRYRVPADGALDAGFLAVRDDRYFVSPADALDRGELTIDGEAVREPVFALGKGAHAIAYRGAPGDIEILWLPRNGERWTPRRGLPPAFSRLF